MTEEVRKAFPEMMDRLQKAFEVAQECMNNVTTIKDGFKDIEQMLKQSKGKLSKIDMDTTASGTSTANKVNKKYPKEKAQPKNQSSKSEQSQSSSQASNKKSKSKSDSNDSAKQKTETKPRRARDRKAAEKANEKIAASKEEPSKEKDKGKNKKKVTDKGAEQSSDPQKPHSGYDKDKHEINGKNKGYFNCPKALEFVKDLADKKTFVTQTDYEEKVLGKMNDFFGSDDHYVQFNEDKRPKYVQICCRRAGCPFNYWCNYDSSKTEGPPEKLKFFRFINQNHSFAAHSK